MRKGERTYLEVAGQLTLCKVLCCARDDDMGRGLIIRSVVEVMGVVRVVGVIELVGLACIV